MGDDETSLTFSQDARSAARKIIEGNAAGSGEKDITAKEKAALMAEVRECLQQHRPLFDVLVWLVPGGPDGNVGASRTKLLSYITRHLWSYVVDA